MRFSLKDGACGLICFLVLAGVSPAPAGDEPPLPTAEFVRIGPFGGTVRSLLISAVDPKTVYLGTSDGHIFKSGDGAESWRLLYPGLNRAQLVVDTLVQHPEDPDHIYAGAWDLRSGGGGLFESRDAGRSWSEVTLPDPSPAVRDFSVSREHPSYMIAGSLAGVFVSEDGGSSWRETTLDGEEFRQVESVAIDPEEPRFLYVGTWHLGYRSADFGKTWRRNSKGMVDDSDMFSLSVDAANPNVVFASACTGIYRSTNRGASWTRLRVFPDKYLVRAQRVHIDPTDSSRIYGGTTEGLFLSADGGRKWRRITSPTLTVNAVQVDPSNNRKILIGTDTRGVLRSEDGGHTWTASNPGFVHRRISRIMHDPGAKGRLSAGVLADGEEGGLYVFDDREGRWAELPDGHNPGAGVLALARLPDGSRLAGTTSGVYVQSPGSETWTKAGGRLAKLAVNDFGIDDRNGWVFAGTSDGVYRAPLESLTFEKPTGYRLIPRVFSILMQQDAAGATTIMTGTHMGVLRSRDHGATWDFMSRGIPDRTTVQCLAPAPQDPRRIFAGTSAGLFITVDGGITWQAAADGRLGVDIPSVIFLDPAGSRIMAADNTTGGVFYSRDGGATWTRIYSDEFRSPVRSLAQDPIRPDVIYLGTATEGIYRMRILPARIQTMDRQP